MGICLWKLDADEVMHSQMSSIYGYFGADVERRICISSTKGNVVQILAYVQFYKSENLCAYGKSAFYAYTDF